MLEKLRPRSVYDALAAIGCFAALATSSAYAANTIGSADIIDGEIKSADVKDESLTTFDVSTFLGADVVDGTLTAADLGSGSVGSDEVVNDSLLQSDIRAGAVTNDEVLNNTLIGADVQDNTLTGADVNESTLAMPPTTTASFEGLTTGPLPSDNSFKKIATRNLAAGSYALIATVNTSSGFPVGEDANFIVICELRNGANFIGGAHDRRVSPQADDVFRTLTMSGGAQVPAGGGEVSVWCKGNGLEQVDYGHMVILRVDGFF
jgi:hypothetical protein